MVGDYDIVLPETGEVIATKLHVNDILLFERVYSFLMCRQMCYMSNAEFAKQLGFCESTASKCISRLKKIGLVEVFIDKKFNGRIKDTRYIYVQPSRMLQIIAERKKAAKKGHPYDCLLLQPLEGQTEQMAETQPLAETQPFEETEQKPRRREALKEK